MDYMFLVEELFFPFYFGCCLLYSEKKDMNVKDFEGSSTDSDDYGFCSFRPSGSKKTF